MTARDHRETVFARIREALRRPAPHRHDGHVDYNALDHPEAEIPPPATETFREWLPVVGPGIEDKIALFAQNSVVLKTDFRVVTSLDEAATQLIAIAIENGWKKIASHRNPLVEKLAKKVGLPCLVTEAGYAPADLETCDAAITGCDALVAQTGTVLVSAPSAGGRALSVLPPHHIVVATREQMTPDLAAALQVVRARYAPNWPSFLSFITGPSRTGDIERILVLGAHGPKKLTILLLP